jgi:hypothetical protein
MGAEVCPLQRQMDQGAYSADRRPDPTPNDTSALKRCPATRVAFKAIAADHQTATVRPDDKRE